MKKWVVVGASVCLLVLASAANVPARPDYVLRLEPHGATGAGGDGSFTDTCMYAHIHDLRLRGGGGGGGGGKKDKKEKTKNKRGGAGAGSARGGDFGDDSDDLDGGMGCRFSKSQLCYITLVM